MTLHRGFTGSHESGPRRAQLRLCPSLLVLVLWALFNPRLSLADEVTPPLSTAPAVDKKEVLDFCYMPIKRGGKHSHKQRLVLFGLAGREVAFGPEQELNEKGEVIPGVEHHVLRDTQIDSHLRSVYLSTYLMKRFYTVEAHTESPKTLTKKATVSDQDMIDAAGVDSFAAYSVACTDWVVFPRLVSKDAKWQKVKLKKQVNGKEVEVQEWHFNLVWSIEADVFHRDATGFSLAATVNGSNGGALGAAYELAALAPHRDFGGGPATAPLLSKRPAPGCNPPLLPALSALTQGMSECAKSLTGLGSLASSALTEDQAAVTAAASAEQKPPPTPSATDAAKGTGLKAPKPVKDAKKGLTEAASATKGTEPGQAVEVVESAMTDEERAVVEALTKSQDKAVVDRVLALEATAKSSRVLKLVGSVKGTWGDCQKPVAAVKAVSSELRSMSQDPAGAAGKALLGLAACAGIDLSPDLSTASPPGTDQLASKYCMGVDANVARGAAAMNDVGVCQGRVAMERSTLDAQNETKRLPGISLSSGLTALPGNPGLFGISLGKDEGADRGDMYVALARGSDGKPERVGFGRIYLAGPGGDGADSAPSQFKFRSGDADQGLTKSDGVRMVEHAQIGVPLGFRPQASYYLLKGDLKTKLAYGAAIEGGYNASKFVPVADEVWGRAVVSFSAGTEKEMFGTLELSPEVVHYLGGGFAAYGGAGFAIVYAQKSVDTLLGKTETLKGVTYGALLNLGIDYALNPDWNARLAVGYRQGVNATKLQNEGKTREINAGSLSAAHAGVSAGYTF